MDNSKCLFDPFDKETIKKLENYAEFQFQIKDKPKFIAYLILVYDRNSDLFLMHADNLYQRKKEAALLVGFKLDKDKHFDEHVEQVLLGENADFNLALFRYTRLSGIPDLPVLIKYLEMLDTELSIPLSGKAKDRGDVMKNIDTLRAKIEELEVRIFTGKETEAARETLYSLIEKIRAPRPENMAEDIENKTLDLPDLYNTQQN
jgi:hypothetical protein